MARRKQSKRRTRRTRRTRGAGYGFEPSRALSPGLMEVMRYDGPGKDCASMPSVSSKPFGLPGLSGGSHKRMKRAQGGTYGFTTAGDMLLSPAPIQKIPCSMQGGANLASTAYPAATAGYTLSADLGVPGLLRTVGYPDTKPTCMNGGSRKRSKRTQRKRKTRRHH